MQCTGCYREIQSSQGKCEFCGTYHFTPYVPPLQTGSPGTEPSAEPIRESEQPAVPAQSAKYPRSEVVYAAVLTCTVLISILHDLFDVKLAALHLETPVNIALAVLIGAGTAQTVKRLFTGTKSILCLTFYIACFLTEIAMPISSGETSVQLYSDYAQLESSDPSRFLVEKLSSDSLPMRKKAAVLLTIIHGTPIPYTDENGRAVTAKPDKNDSLRLKKYLTFSDRHSVSLTEMQANVKYRLDKSYLQIVLFLTVFIAVMSRYQIQVQRILKRE